MNHFPSRAAVARAIRVFGSATGGALLLLTIPGISSAGAAADVTPTGVDPSVLFKPTIGEVALTGTLTGGVGAGPGKVAALAWPDDKTLVAFSNAKKPFTTPTVGWAAAGPDGRFQLSIDRSLLPSGYINQSGQVNLEIVGWRNGIAGSTSTSVWLGRSPASLASIGAPALPNIAIGLNNAFAHASTFGFGQSVSAAGGCTSNWVDIATTWPTEQMGETLPYPYAPVQAQFSITTSETMTLGVGVSNTGNYGNWSAGGSYSFTNSTGHTFAWSTSDQGYYTTVRYDEYRDYNHWCETYLPQYEWIGLYDTSAGWTGGISYPYWGYSAYESPQVWSRSGGYSFSLSSGVFIGYQLGINLSVSESYSSNYTERYNFTGGGWMCGNNNYPSLSSRVEQC